MVLIIGATGYIGSYLFRILKDGVEECIGTRFHSQNQELLKFDILEDKIENINKNIVAQHKEALLCSADSKIDYCLTNRDEAYHKNVTSTIQLIQSLQKLGYHITFLSTDYVFDGIRGNYKETDMTNPINQYGRMKEKVEHYLLEKVPNSCIMRIGKVVGNLSFRNDLLLEWCNKAKRKEQICCIQDNRMNLVHIEDIAAAYSLIRKYKLTGIYHIAGGQSGLRKELCKDFLGYMKLEYDITEKKFEEFPFLERRPLDTSMDSSKFIKETGFQFMGLDKIWERFSEERLELEGINGRGKKFME